MRNDEFRTDESDIDVLKQHLGQRDLDYLDLSTRCELERVIARWPLLGELAVPAALPSAVTSEEELLA